jgi:hypothetical protein
MYNFVKSTTVKLSEGDSVFTIIDGMVTMPRASLEFSADCPAEYIQMIQRARMKGWLKLAAYVKEEEYLWDQMKSVNN